MPTNLENSAPPRNAGRPTYPANKRSAPYARSGPAGSPASTASKPKPEPVVLFQKYFKSVGPRTYAAQVKELANGNQLLVLTEGKRDEQTGEVRKTRLFVYGEDLPEFFKLLNETAAFLRAHPMPESIRKRREKFWEKKKQTAAPTA